MIIISFTIADITIIMTNLTKDRTFQVIAFEAIATFILTYGACASGRHSASNVIVSCALFLGIAISA